MGWQAPDQILEFIFEIVSWMTGSCWETRGCVLFVRAFFKSDAWGPNRCVSGSEFSFAVLRILRDQLRSIFRILPVTSERWVCQASELSKHRYRTSMRIFRSFAWRILG